MDIYLAIVCVWIVVGNAWHGILLAQRKGTRRPPTISQHAVESKQLLLTHRVVHSLPMLVFMPAIFGYLLPEGHGLAAGLLLSAAVFDCIETITLNKRNAALSSPLNAHFVTAWLMALSYFAYAIVISRIAELSSLVYVPILSFCMLLVIFANKGVSKNKSLAMQMAYFMLVSSVGLIAHIKLILS